MRFGTPKVKLGRCAADVSVVTHDDDPTHYLFYPDAFLRSCGTF